jgi:gamma-glutamylcyclotransferase (GGCT)/AIG2-like uncharacterized protein YtfP
MPLYFAYGANMDVEDMARRCPRSQLLGVARLMRHRLAITREGWLTATRDARGRVHGVLWDLALADVSALDRFEQLGDGLYVKTTQAVIAGSGPKRALVYFGANAGPGRADGDYIRAVIASARHWRLPEDGLAALEGFARVAGAAGEGHAAPRVRPRFATPFDR